MKNIEKILLGLSWIALFSYFAILLFLFTSCSPAKKINSEASEYIDSLAVEQSISTSSKINLNVSSGRTLNITIDSLRIFPLNILPLKENPPDKSTRPLPLVAAAYGIGMSATSSDSVAASAVAKENKESSAESKSSKKSSKEAEQKKEGGNVTLMGITFFLFIILAIILAMRYLDRK